jgi:hypothetical protein
MAGGFSCSSSQRDMIVANLGVLGAISFERLFTRCVENCSVVHLAVMYFGTKIRGVIVCRGYGQQIISCFKLGMVNISLYKL